MTISNIASCPSVTVPQSGPASTPAYKPCHNCRRRRLRCDRSQPACQKCIKNGERCLGYGTLLRWTHAVASHGKMAGRSSFGEAEAGALVSSADRPRSGLELGAVTPAVSFSLVDPLLQDMSTTARYYVNHFSAAVCKDLVSYDRPDRNPFRFMITLMGRFPYLREIVVAIGAIHLVARRRARDQRVGEELIDAFSARASAIRLLRHALNHIDESNRQAILAAVVFFVNFDLIDSGRGGWKTHLDAAGTLVRTLCPGGVDAAGPQRGANSFDLAMAQLGDVVIADCLTYHIFGATLSVMDETTAQVYDGIDIPAVLGRAEAYTYHGCPPEILRIVAQANRTIPSGRNGWDVGNDGRHQDETNRAVTSLLAQAVAVDVREWVHSIRGLAPEDDRETRVKLASAHRAAACLYISLIAPSGGADSDDGTREAARALVDEILGHLSSIPENHELFKGSVWPAFLAGGQTDDPAQRLWCLTALKGLWLSSTWISPWGYVQTATKTLQQIWAVRDGLPPAQRARWNWLRELRSSGESALIV
ncbi:hypothetical protein VTK73DRAFT_9050 [Phialemonium thermophilum]|uniref:Zn(2)-C6 fungal-type domain-containing protein n=1 Tax=Phialemonium thermophilum TaxID=223376 RepID=A0ABR3W561_9PEZI